MKGPVRRSVIALAFGVAAICGCDQKRNASEYAALTRNVHLDGLDYERRDVVDHYLPIDRRAFRYVSPADKSKALSGDGPAAVAIGNAFAAANYTVEARFWYQVAAENGDPIGMTHYSVLLSELSCERANFWQRKALERANFGPTHKEMERLLRKSEAECKPSGEVASAAHGEMNRQGQAEIAGVE